MSEDKHRRRRCRTALLAAAKERFQQMQDAHNGDLLAPISPTPPSNVSLVISRLRLSDESLLIDLGCGDGRWLIQACQETGCQAVGCDVDEERLAVARSAVNQSGLSDKIQIVRRDALDFLQHSPLVTECNVIVVYLFRDAMERVSDIIRQRLVLDQSTGCVQVVSVGFSLPGFISVWDDVANGVRMYLYETRQEYDAHVENGLNLRDY